MDKEALVAAIERGNHLIENYKREGYSDFPIRGSATGKCPRELRALLGGAPKRQLEARALRIFEMGTGRGEALALALAHGIGVDGAVEFEVEVWTGLGILDPIASEILGKAMAEFPKGNADLPIRVSRGGELEVRSRCDAVVKVNGNPSIVEFKTANSWKINKIAKGDEWIDDTYLTQVLCQAQGLTNKLDVQIERVTVIYESKDDSSLLPLEVPVLDHLGFWEEKRLRVCALLEDWYHGTIETPAVFAEGWEEMARLPWQCNYCGVGPLVGGCVPEARLVNKPKNGVPQWYINHEGEAEA